MQIQTCKMQVQVGPWIHRVATEWKRVYPFKSQWPEKVLSWYVRHFIWRVFTGLYVWRRGIYRELFSGVKPFTALSGLQTWAALPSGDRRSQNLYLWYLSGRGGRISVGLWQGKGDGKGSRFFHKLFSELIYQTVSKIKRLTVHKMKPINNPNFIRH